MSPTASWSIARISRDATSSQCALRHRGYRLPADPMTAGFLHRDPGATRPPAGGDARAGGHVRDRPHRAADRELTATPHPLRNPVSSAHFTVVIDQRESADASIRLADKVIAQTRIADVSKETCRRLRLKASLCGRIHLDGYARRYESARTAPPPPGRSTRWRDGSPRHRRPVGERGTDQMSAADQSRVLAWTTGTALGVVFADYGTSPTVVPHVVALHAVEPIEIAVGANGRQRPDFSVVTEGARVARLLGELGVLVASHVPKIE